MEQLYLGSEGKKTKHNLETFPLMLNTFHLVSQKEFTKY